MRRMTGALVLALLGWSVTARATEPFFVGADSLHDMMSFLFGTGGYNFDPQEIVYSPEGSGLAEDVLEAQLQEWAPMDRFLTKVWRYGCGRDEPLADPDAGCWQVAVDTIVVLANEIQTADADCQTLAWGQNMPVGDANGNGVIQCPGCVPGGPTGRQYPFTDWRSVLRILYAGQEVNGVNDTTSALDSAARCNSDVRRTLVNTWSNFFKDQADVGACPTGACANGLRHAFRPDDVSGTTEGFLAVLGLPPILAPVSSVPIPPLAANPFCNGTDIDDADPIRRSCGSLTAAGDGFVPAGQTTSEDTICGFGKDPRVRNAQGHLTAASSGAEETLGLVVPVLLGIPNAYTTYPNPDPSNPGSGAQNCGGAGEPIAGGGAAFARVSWPLADQLRYGPRCPNGAPSTNGCFWPKRAGTGGNPSIGFGCIAATNNRPSDTVGGTGAASGFDARIYNLWSRNEDGTVKSYTRGIGLPPILQNKRAFAAFYKYRQHRCREPDATSQQGCFVNDDPCVTGFAGRSAFNGFGNVRGVCMGTNPLAGDACPVQEQLDTYALTRPMYICQLDVVGSAPLQDPNFMSAQQEIYDDVVADNHTIIDLGVAAAGLFAVPEYTKNCCSGTWDGPGTDSCSP